MTLSQRADGTNLGTSPNLHSDKSKTNIKANYFIAFMWIND